jgi:hypothetical protein
MPVQRVQLRVIALNLVKQPSYRLLATPISK